ATQERGEELYTRRIALNRSYLSSLQAEIQMYSAALENETNLANTELIQSRYQILLAERSTEVDEINIYQQAHKDSEIDERQEIQEPVEPLEVFMDTDANEVDGIEAESSSINSSQNYVKNIEKKFTANLDTIEAEDLNEIEKMQQIASLNEATAVEIDSIVGT